MECRYESDPFRPTRHFLEWRKPDGSASGRVELLAKDRFFDAAVAAEVVMIPAGSVLTYVRRD